jgi:(2Fe-2S) ferredoxin
VSHPAFGLRKSVAALNLEMMERIITCHLIGGVPVEDFRIA